MVICIGSSILPPTPGIADTAASTAPTPPSAEPGTNDQSGHQRPPCCPVESDVDADGEARTTEQPEPVDPPALDASTPTANARASEWILPEDRDHFDLDFEMTDQNGQALTFGDLVGKPLAISFIFTRCPNPKMCPLITLTLAHLQRDLELANLAEDVTLVLLTYDPVYDTPERLRQYGLERGLQFSNAVMLRPDTEAFRQLLSEFQIGVDYQADGSIGHFIELLMVDHDGRFVRDYQGDVWDNVAVLEDLKRLVIEQQSAEGRPHGSD